MFYDECQAGKAIKICASAILMKETVLFSCIDSNKVSNMIGNPFLLKCPNDTVL